MELRSALEGWRLGEGPLQRRLKDNTLAELLAAMTRFFRRDKRPWLAGVSVCGVLAVGLTLGTDLARGYPVVSLIAACAIAALLY